MIGKTVSHYDILEELGRGGMGVVYKARDTKLDRLVALKFLPQHLTASEDEQVRFLQEARAASALNHPNVCGIHSIGEYEGQVFIDMEYVAGKTLRARIAEGAVRTADALAYAIQIGDALHEAHSKGIVHRDVKCENIMIDSRNRVKVMDFGLAKLKGSLKLTRTSSTVGTLAYMAPEQIQGEVVDARSDIFSFGIVLFEMLTGRMPFRGEHEAAVMYSIVNEAPEPPSKVRPEVSSEVDRIVLRALEKDPDDRYQHVDDMVSELRKLQKQTSRVSRAIDVNPVVGTGVEQIQPARAEQISVPEKARRRAPWIIPAGGALLVAILAAVVFFGRGIFQGQHSGARAATVLAVLPFENLGAQEDEYFADGMTDAVRGKLAALPGIQVIARASSSLYKRTTKSPQQIAQELNVEYLLTGTIRWERGGGGPGRVQVTPELVRVAAGNQATTAWEQPFDAVMSDLFSVQSQIAEQVARNLGVTLQASGGDRGAPTKDLEAYDYYLRGQEYQFRSTEKDNFEKAVNLYTKAIERDPSFALARAARCQTSMGLYWFRYDHTQERLRLAREDADAALGIDPQLPEGHIALGYYYYWGFLDYSKALEHFSIARQAQPNNANLAAGIGYVERRRGDLEQALRDLMRASELDPRAAILADDIGYTYGFLGRYEEADRHYDRASILSPDWWAPYAERAWVKFCSTGSAAEGRRLLEESQSQVRGDLTLFDFARIRFALLEGNGREALEQIRKLTQNAASSHELFTPKGEYYARAYTLLHEPSLALAYYDSARALAAAKVKSEPGESQYYSALGIALAGLGRKDEAIAAGKRGVELLPASKDALDGQYRLYELARIYVLVGENEAALGQLKLLLSRPCGLIVSPRSLRADPTWAPLKDDPRFEKLVTGEK